MMMQPSKIDSVVARIKHPAKVAIAIVQDEEGRFNSITLEWFMRTSINPPMFAISIGHTRYSYECLQKNRYFNLCFPSLEMKHFTILSGTKSGRDLDKIETSKEPWFKGKLKQFPILQNAVATFECKVITQVRSGDHTIYVGEVEHAWQNSDKELLLVEHIF
jgi:flavin reductase (DIM6/NTAB) family NADH-FMN oxidoreductase RutF